MQFEWDPEKARINLSKHRVRFDESSTVFGDPLALTIDDPDHSYQERRLLTTGFSAKGRLIIVAHTHREGAIRIISARPVSRNERKQYESEV